MLLAVGFNPRWRRPSARAVAQRRLKIRVRPNLEHRYATRHTCLPAIRGLKPAATVRASLREAGRGAESCLEHLDQLEGQAQLPGVLRGEMASESRPSASARATVPTNFKSFCVLTTGMLRSSLANRTGSASTN